MTLRLEEIKKITFGALSITEEDGAFRFDRFSEEQKAVYEIENQEFKRRCDGTASVMLDFITDSENFSFSFSVRKTSGKLLRLQALITSAVLSTLRRSSRRTGSTSMLLLLPPT